MIASTVPGIIAWPLIIFMMVVLAGRYWFFNNNLYERYFNNTLAFLLAAQILREHVVQDILVKAPFITLPVMWQFSSAVMAYSFTEFIGFSLLWSGLSENNTRRKHRYYRLVAAFLAAGLWISGSPARRDKISFEELHGWGSMANLFCMIAMLLVLASHLIWNSRRELRTVGSRRERLIALSTLAMGVIGVGVVLHEAVLHTLDQLGWTETSAYRRDAHAATLFFGILAPFTIAAVPLARKLLGALGLDPTTRSWRKLQPLRQAMRTVVPECIFTSTDDEAGPIKSAVQLHHTVVEIRDAILRLRPYHRVIPDDDVIRFLGQPHAIPPRERGAAIQALRLVYAARTKAAGITVDPADVDSAALIVASRATTLEEEAAELITLAKWWPAAYAATEPNPTHESEPT